MITLVRAFADVFNLYGDRAGVDVLAARLRSVGATVHIVDINWDDPQTAWQDLDANLVAIGAGPEKALPLALERLRPQLGTLQAMRNRGGMVWATGAASALFGQELVLPTQRLAGLGLGDQSFIYAEPRRTGDCLATTPLVAGPVVGSLNSSLIETESAYPLFEITKCSDPGLCGMEGHGSDGLLTTQLSGPLLVANPDLLDCLVGVLTGAVPSGEENWLGYARAAYATLLNDLDTTL